MHIRSMEVFGSHRPDTGLLSKSSSDMSEHPLRTTCGGAPPSCGKIWKVTLCPACDYYGAGAPT